MKLKILLMPVSIIVSAVLIIWHIYPAWFGEDLNSINNIKSSVEKKEKEINDIKSRKANIGKLTQSLESNSDTVSLVDKFYPIYRNDEDVINTVNSIAFNEGVFMSDMKVEYLNITPSDDSIKKLALPLEKIEAVVTNEVQTAIDGSVPAMETNENGTPPEDLLKSKMKFIEIMFELEGSYEQLKKFVISSSNAGLINNIQFFKIYKKEKQGEDKENGENILTADMILNFAYFPSSNEDANKLLLKEMFSKNEFDFSEIDDKKDILIGNYKQSEIGEVGAPNPFSEDLLAE